MDDGGASQAIGQRAPAKDDVIDSEYEDDEAFEEQEILDDYD